MRKTTAAVVAALLAASFGCGGAQKTEGSTTPAGEGREAQSAPPAEVAIPAEKIEEVQATFRRKTTQVQSCYTDEMERNGNKKMEGDVTLAMVLAPSGMAEDVRVSKSTLKSPQIEACVVEQVKSWHFTELPQKAYFNWTFHFKPAY